jgi:hypothetical protein
MPVNDISYDMLRAILDHGQQPEENFMKIVENIHDLTLGADIELGLYHMNTSQYIPATSFNTPGTKGEYVELRDSSDVVVGTYHRDNITVEYQTIPSCGTAQDFASAVVRPFGALNRHYSDFINADLEAAPAVHFGDPEMLLVPEALEMGCEPDMCAYTLEEVKGPKAATLGPWRVCSGHVHFGHEALAKASLEEKALFVRLLDRLVGVGVVGAVYTATWRRRFFYGQAGRFRIKPYGLEYRTPDNSWTAASSKNMWARCVHAFNIWMAGDAQKVLDRIEVATEMDTDAVRHMIDNPLDLTIEAAGSDVDRGWQSEQEANQEMEEQWGEFSSQVVEVLTAYYDEEAA